MTVPRTMPAPDPAPGEEPTVYALFSHESAVEAIWALAEKKWRGVLSDEDIWLVPDARNCVTTQGDYKRLAAEVDLPGLGIRSTPADLLVPNKSCASRGKRARFHVWRDFFPPKSFVRVHDRVLISTPYFAALQLAMARRASRLVKDEAQVMAQENAHLRAEAGLTGEAPGPEDLVAWKNIARFVRAAQVLTDFMGTYRYLPSDGNDSVVYGTSPIVTRAKFEEYLNQMPSSKGIMRARQVASAAFSNSASPMETMLALVLTLPVEMGGFGLPRPVLNRKIAPNQDELDLCSKSEMYADLCWEQQRVIVEYYGWNEHFGMGPRKVGEDAARANTLAALGWTVLHVTYEAIRTAAGLQLLARQLAHALKEDLRPPTELETLWRTRLIALLLPPVSERSYLNARLPAQEALL